MSKVSFPQRTIPITFIANPYFFHKQKTQNNYTLVQKQGGTLQRKYELSLDKFRAQSGFFQWRKKIHHPIPKITQINSNLDSTGKAFVSVKCQHVIINFQDLRLLKIEQVIYSMSQMLLGYRQICNRLGFICIDPQLMGINSKGQILIWISQNLLDHNAQYKKIKQEKQIVIKIIQILQSKAQNQNHLFFKDISKIQPKFIVILDFLMEFKNLFKLKIIPKIFPNLKNQNYENMFASNTFSANSAQFYNLELRRNRKNRLIGENALISNCQSESQFLPTNRSNSNKTSTVEQNHINRSSFSKSDVNHTPINWLPKITEQRQTPKINFSYSQQRPGLTPKPLELFKDYTSETNNYLLPKSRSQIGYIKQFTLDDRKCESTNGIKRRRTKQDRKIVRTYAIAYKPINDTIYLQNEEDLKRLNLSFLFSSVYNSRLNANCPDVNNSKSSMTTNHHSARTQSFQSICKSIDEQNSHYKNNLFISNDSHQSTYSTLKTSFMENISGKNTTSFVIGKNIPESYSKPKINLNGNHYLGGNKQNNNYTFGGLLTPLHQQKHQFKKSVTLQEFFIPTTSIVVAPHPSKQKLSLTNQFNTKSIDQLYNNIHFNSEQKSVVVNESHENSQLSPIKEKVQNCNNESFTIDLSQIKGYQPLPNNSKPQSDRSLHQFLAPNIEEATPMECRQWKGIKGLLGSSNMYEMKQSIHCGPEIRAPLNIKLELLGKFGRDIGQSILASTPTVKQYSRAQPHIPEGRLLY